jgi:lysophospholipase L1-like esterase
MEYRDQRMGLFASLTVEGKHALVGDSLFDGSEWDELLPGQATANRGIGGAETATILEGLDVFLAQQPRSIFLMVGINDLRHFVPLDEVKRNYTKVIARITARSIPLFVNSVIPVGVGHDDADMINEWVASLNDHLIALARSHAFEFVDLRPVLSENGFLRSSCTNDNLHLTAEGYLAWREVLLPRLASLSPARGTHRRTSSSIGIVR